LSITYHDWRRSLRFPRPPLPHRERVSSTRIPVHTATITTNDYSILFLQLFHYFTYFLLTTFGINEQFLMESLRTLLQLSYTFRALFQQVLFHCHRLVLFFSFLLVFFIWLVLCRDGPWLRFLHLQNSKMDVAKKMERRPFSLWEV
jgi:hypothetical protein